MPKKIPLRMCVSCRARKPKRDLIRVVVMPDMTLTIDQVGKTPGRGAYVCRSRDCLREAIKGRKIDKGLKTRISEQVIAELVAQIENLPADDAETT